MELLIDCSPTKKLDECQNSGMNHFKPDFKAIPLPTIVWTTLQPTTSTAKYFNLDFTEGEEKEKDDI